MQVVVRVALVVAVVVLVVLALAWVFQRRLIYLPDTTTVPPAAEVLPGGEDVRLRTSDGLDLGAWFVAPPGAPAAVLVANGNAGNRAGRAPLAAKLARAGLAVLVFDYRGYGDNPGDPSEAGLALDVRAAYRFLTGRTPAPIIFYGESLGCAVVAELALEHPPAGLLLRSPFVDLASVGAESYPFLPVRLLLRDRFPVRDEVTRLKVPTVVVVGGRDSVVPPEQSRAVAAAASARLVEVPGADHNDPVLADGPELVDAVRSLVPR
ncbi:lysophospholipase [Amycolatopsis sp. OK19-0408]|uniref:Lysophospholipase n=1 Tax=Amycolatopsis iheyensis TaxID=2945988 RepID=A0A9X2NAC4_9PSEU|nr:lysophospholipase [Amycolatopsis iheyensis]MCR6484979.1 lysophospholipase [Amycolatopsis iheyensis]